MKYLQHLGDVTGAKNPVDSCEGAGVRGWKIWQKDAGGGAPASEKLACGARHDLVNLFGTWHLSHCHAQMINISFALGKKKFLKVSVHI